jgi:YHS domain-containing protein
VIRIILIGILLLLIARAFWRLMDGVIEALGGTARTRARGRAKDTSAMKLEKDPVCGTHVSTASALSLAAGGSTHYFCSEQCRDTFRRTA